MKGTAIRRLKINFCGFNNFNKGFCTNIKKSTRDNGLLYVKHNPHLMEILLNEPKKLNSLDLRMIKSMLRRVRRWLPENISSTSSDEERSDKTDIEEEDVPNVVLMSGAGGKAFCAGGDIASLYWEKKNNNNDKVIKNFFRYEYLLDYSLTRMKPIQIALLNGYVMGGGAGISIHAPIRIATDNTLFAMPETAIGLFPDVGATYFLPRIFNEEASVGLYMALIGDRIKGIDLAKCGVATHFVPSKNLEELKKTLIDKCDEEIDLPKLEGIVKDYSELVYSPENFDFPKLDEIKRTFLLDSVEELFARLDNLVENGSEDEKNWASTMIKNLNKVSPISLVVTFEQMKRGVNIKTIEEAFNLEAQLVAAFIEDSDFFEGVRALLIEKDLNPKWKYKSYKDINKDELIQKFFERQEEINVDPNQE